ncbi:uncharacterized protein LOC115622027 [Scaptodrosophila lebanonensis]|uniref:Uncharacterized protein LOC115622027 n=1 Tax=Drosophila lebanonensis TaxID=7225 RepID=A0A6J2T8W5_DROLE|nr:uncharacterized protein LOC115622027 [Scaptodrosophila lebanonensis]
MPTIHAASNGTDFGIITFPAEKEQCTCALLSMSCTCCQSVVVNIMNITRRLCMTFKLSILSVSVDVTITLDGNQVSQFSISAKNPPTYCMPMLDPTPLAMCVKVHDVKVVGLTGVQICSTFYTSFDTNQIFAYEFPCVKLSTSGVELM